MSPGNRNRSALAAACIAIAGIACGAHAQVIQSYEYQPDRIYPVYAGLGITTQIELSPHEKILDYSTGFSSGWDLTRRDNVFYLKPRNVDVDTNMMIRTETHAYIFELKVTATDWKTLESARAAGVQYKIRFNYPSDASFSNEAAKAEKAPELDTSLVPGRSYHFDYDYATRDMAAPWLVPVTVHDDARFTYLRMADMKQFPTGNFPTVYMRQSERGEDAVVNTTVEGSTIVVHGTYPYLVIRHGSYVVGLRRNTVQ
jgi:type IV secretion system protein VirB9